MLILMILLCVKFTDIGAYFGGRALGKHKLILWLSPGKTWEGLFFGLLTAAAVGAVFATFISIDSRETTTCRGGRARSSARSSAASASSATCSKA